MGGKRSSFCRRVSNEERSRSRDLAAVPAPASGAPRVFPPSLRRGFEQKWTRRAFLQGTPSYEALTPARNGWEPAASASSLLGWAAPHARAHALKGLAEGDGAVPTEPPKDWPSRFGPRTQRAPLTRGEAQERSAVIPVEHGASGQQSHTHTLHQKERRKRLSDCQPFPLR